MHPGSWNEAYKTRHLQSNIVHWYNLQSMNSWSAKYGNNQKTICYWCGNPGYARFQ